MIFTFFFDFSVVVVITFLVCFAENYHRHGFKKTFFVRARGLAKFFFVRPPGPRGLGGLGRAGRGWPAANRTIWLGQIWLASWPAGLARLRPRLASELAPQASR